MISIINLGLDFFGGIFFSFPGVYNLIVKTHAGLKFSCQVLVGYQILLNPEDAELLSGRWGLWGAEHAKVGEMIP